VSGRIAHLLLFAGRGPRGTGRWACCVREVARAGFI